MISSLTVLILSLKSYSGLNNRTALAESQMLGITESTGLALATSYSEDLFPLGGYSGIRFGLSNKFISNCKLRRAFSSTSAVSDLNLTEVSFSKGLHSNFDFFFSVTPLLRESNLSSVGGGLRWGFLELHDQPIHFLISISGRSTNWNNQVVFLNQTFDLLAQYSGSSLFSYFGLGNAFVRSQFIGGNHGVTASGLNEVFQRSRGRPLAGVGWRGSKWSVAIELTQFVETIFSAKVSLTDF